jgi:uncharacterized protein YndB with AHSA1/START domain
VVVETVIARPREEVARVVMDPAHDRQWIRALTDVRVVTDSALGAGTRVARTARFLGRRIEYVNEITEYEPPVRLVMRSVKAPFAMTVAYELDDLGGSTRMRIVVSGDASGFYKLASPLLDRAVRKGIAGDLARLKELVEGGGGRAAP